MMEITTSATIAGDQAGMIIIQIKYTNSPGEHHMKMLQINLTRPSVTAVDFSMIMKIRTSKAGTAEYVSLICVRNVRKKTCMYIIVVVSNGNC